MYLIKIKWDQPISGLQTGANKFAGDIFLKSSAVALIRELNNGMAGNQPDDKAMNIMPKFLSSYEDYVASLDKMASLGTDYPLPGHGCYLHSG